MRSVPPEMVKKCLSRMSGKLSRTVLRRGKGSNPFSLVEFTSPDYIDTLKQHGIKISMDGKGRALDNAITERFFRTIKWEDIYIMQYETPRTLRQGIDAFIVYYNSERGHQSLNKQKPDDLYYAHSYWQQERIA